MNSLTRSTAALGATAVATLGLAACSPAEDDGRTEVAVALYPLEFLVDRVGGEFVDIVTITPPGVEPHDVELSPATVRQISNADLLVYIPTFQAAVDDAASTTGVATLAAFTPEAGEDHGDEHADEEVQDHSEGDPHFWLDPTLMAVAAESIADSLATIDPEHADDFARNASAVVDELSKLDLTYVTTLARCDRTDILVSHEAYGYLAARYGLEQHGLSGLNPEAEPSPAKVREIRELAESLGATTIYAETLVNPAIVEAFAADAGLEVAVLDPIEGLTDPDTDYLGIMRSNLLSLQQGLGC